MPRSRSTLALATSFQPAASVSGLSRVTAAASVAAKTVVVAGEKVLPLPCARSGTAVSAAAAAAAGAARAAELGAPFDASRKKLAPVSASRAPATAPETIPAAAASASPASGHWLLPQPQSPCADMVDLSSLRDWRRTSSDGRFGDNRRRSRDASSSMGGGSRRSSIELPSALSNSSGSQLFARSSSACGLLAAAAAAAAAAPPSGDPSAQRSLSADAPAGADDADGSAAGDDGDDGDSFDDLMPGEMRPHLTDDEVLEKAAEIVLRGSRAMVIVAGRDRRFVFVSESVRSVTGGRDPAELLSQTVMDQAHPDDVARVEQISAETREAVERGERNPCRRVELRFREASGDYAWRTFTTTLDPRTGLVYAVCVKSDAAFALQQATLVDLLEELGEDMRAPLAAIEKRLQVLAKVPGLAADPDACARFACVEHSCAVLEGLATAALAVARREGAKLGRPRRRSSVAAAGPGAAPGAAGGGGAVRFDATSFLRDIVGMCRLGAKKDTGGISLSWGAGGPPPCKVLVRVALRSAALCASCRFGVTPGALLPPGSTPAAHLRARAPPPLMHAGQ